MGNNSNNQPNKFMAKKKAIHQSTGQEAYEKFCKQNPTVKTLPWDELSSEVQDKWEARAEKDADLAKTYRDAGLPDPETLAEQLYQIRRDTLGGDLPSWDEVYTDPKGEKEVQGWIDVAVNAIKLLNQKVVHAT